MKRSNGAIAALLFLTTCNQETAGPGASSTIESGKVALGVLPPSEVGVWQKAGGDIIPNGRYLQAAAFDETRKVVVMFSGAIFDGASGQIIPSKELWEWSPATGKWTNRSSAGSGPAERSGATMVFDSKRGKFVLFGGRAANGSNLDDTWEWNPADGTWSDVSGTGGRPKGRCQHGMVYEKSTDKILLFGGGLSDNATNDISRVLLSLNDTWEYDPATHAWTEIPKKPDSWPTIRHDFSLVWDTSRNKAVLFAGLQTDSSSVPGAAKQDTWEWDPATTAWTERTVVGRKPNARYSHTGAFDGSRNKMMVFGGWDIHNGWTLNDLWEWDPTTAAWTQRLTGKESGIPTGRMYASMVSNDAEKRFEVVAGATLYGSLGRIVSASGASGQPVVLQDMSFNPIIVWDTWELDPAKAVFTDRTPVLHGPSARSHHSMAFSPATKKTYLFGGFDLMTGEKLDDLWEWDGKAWAKLTTDERPAGRSSAGLAYDQSRKSLILYGGTADGGNTTLDDTWEFVGGKWIELEPIATPGGLSHHGMVTDTTRNKILVFGGTTGWEKGTEAGKDPLSSMVWEWDGTAMTWTNRTPTATFETAPGRELPVVAYDEGRQKLFVYDEMDYNGSSSLFWEWDTISAGWAMRDTKDALTHGATIGFFFLGTYDPALRRVLVLTDSIDKGYEETWELDGNGPTWYVRKTLGSPGGHTSPAMAFDSIRDVIVLCGGGSQMGGFLTNDTWEYNVTNVANGGACTADFASRCASGNCVDGVCCDVATCTGACMACNVPGFQGTCVLAKPGTEVPGSCESNQACDGTGACKTKNGQPCTTASPCASANCVDGVCCDSACTGECSSCNLTGQAGKCRPYTAGTDPEGECGKGTGVCKSTCDGVSRCAFPQPTLSCGDCMTCDGAGTCSLPAPYCNLGSGGKIGGEGGNTYPTGGTGGIVIGGSGGRGGSGGNGGNGGNTGSGGNTGGVGGTAGASPNFGGAAGKIPSVGGAAGSIPSVGGTTGSIPSVGGTTGNIPNDGGQLERDGSSGSRDAGGSDAKGKVTTKSSGCSCELGHAGATGSEMGLVAGTACFLLLKRRRKRQARH
jgi:hypothetical protein